MGTLRDLFRYLKIYRRYIGRRMYPPGGRLSSSAFRVSHARSAFFEIAFR
jgi:hypothetical protein